MGCIIMVLDRHEPGTVRHRAAVITEFAIPGDDPNPIGVTYHRDYNDGRTSIPGVFLRSAVPQTFLGNAEGHGTQRKRSCSDDDGVYFASSPWTLEARLEQTQAALAQMDGYATGQTSLRSGYEYMTVAELRGLVPAGVRKPARKADLIELLVRLAAPTLRVGQYAGTLRTGDILALPRRGAMKIMADHLYAAARKGTLIIGDVGAYSFAGGITFVDADDLTLSQRDLIAAHNAEHDRLMGLVTPTVARLRDSGYSIYHIAPHGQRADGTPVFSINASSRKTGQVYGSYTVSELDAEQFRHTVQTV